jgi:hypothetical protein
MRSRNPAMRRIACAALLALSFTLAPELAHAQSAARKAGRGPTTGIGCSGGPASRPRCGRSSARG